jgi:hypothetical protein
MISVFGSARRSFVFPSNLPTAFAYYSDLDRILSYLPHISVLKAYSANRFHMLYSTTELATYRIRVHADVQATPDKDARVLRVSPLTSLPPVRAEAGIRSSTAQGYFSSESIFYDEGDETRIEYSLRLECRLPTPLAMRFIPSKIVDRIAESVTEWRIREIVDGFIERSIHEFARQRSKSRHRAVPTRRP